MKRTRDYHQSRLLTESIFGIEKELGLDYINVPKVRQFSDKLMKVKLEELKEIKLTLDQYKRFVEAEKVVVGESTDSKLAIVKNQLVLVNESKKTFRRIA